jgi:hypothetical protein
MNASAGKYIILLGAAIILIGLAVYFLHDKLHWIGRLPGDIRVEKENLKFYSPITTMILFGIMLNIFIVLIRKFFG